MDAHMRLANVGRGEPFPPQGLESVYRAALAADSAFGAALRKRFGARAGDARYDATRRGWTKAVVAAHDAWIAADDAWLAAYRKARRENEEA